MASPQPPGLAVDWGEEVEPYAHNHKNSRGLLRFIAEPLLYCTTRTWVCSHILSIPYQSPDSCSCHWRRGLFNVARAFGIIPVSSYARLHQRTPSQWLDGLGTHTDTYAGGWTSRTFPIVRRTHASQEPRQPFRAGYNPFGFLSFSPSVLPRRVVCISGGLWRGLIPLSCLFETKLLAPEPGCRGLARRNFAEARRNFAVALDVYGVVFFRPQDFEHGICTLIWLGWDRERKRLTMKRHSSWMLDEGPYFAHILAES